MQDQNKPTPQLLGEYRVSIQRFEDLNALLKEFTSSKFKKLPSRKKFKKVNQTLLSQIQKAPNESFLLTAVIEYIDWINHHKILDTYYAFHLFEFWLNNFSGLKEEENYLVRAKIVGKYIPRDDYQAFFPIGMGKKHPGSHFSTAHLSPDVDTTIASFWGWVDSFGCQVSEAQHQWCLPGGSTDGHIRMIFSHLFSEVVFSNLARVTSTLTLSAMDLLTQNNMVRENDKALVSHMNHGQGEKAIVYVDEEGHYLGDWRSSDVESVRQVSMMFNACMRWYENHLHSKLITLFAKRDLNAKELSGFLQSIFELVITDCESIQEFSPNQRINLHNFFSQILGLSMGISATFGDLQQSLIKLSLEEFEAFHKKLTELGESGLFAENGDLLEDRPLIFNHLEKIIHTLDLAIQSARNYVERLDIAMRIKHEVLERTPHYVTMGSEVEEIRLKMKNFNHLTVVIPERDGKLFPVGIVSATTLRRKTLGTVTMRDFCNQEETRMASYLDVISIIDHHKASIRTGSAPIAIIGDAQSSNVLVAEQAFLINDRYSCAGMTLDQINEQIQDLLSEPPNAYQSRLLNRLFMRRIAAQEKNEHYVHPDREFCAYLSFLYAIIDDTDLLSKVTNRDVECVGSLLNRLKTLTVQQEVEIINFDDLPRDASFAKKAAERILQNVDMYSIYKEIYAFKEKELEDNLRACIEGKPSNIFSDTKEQNGCCRVGQTKMFASNFPFFKEHDDEMRKIWTEKAKRSHKHSPELDLHLHMISTISSADEVYQGSTTEYTHQDEFWVWIPPYQEAYEHLASFLGGFQDASEEMKQGISLEFYGKDIKLLEEAFKQNFLDCPIKYNKGDEETISHAVLRFKAGSLNSRKSKVTPYLPQIVG